MDAVRHLLEEAGGLNTTGITSSAFVMRGELPIVVYRFTSTI